MRRRDYMQARQAACVLRQGMLLCEKPDLERSTLKRDTISWRIEHAGWTTVSWVTVMDYAPGLIRLRNDVYPSIPREMWPFALPQRQRFELRFYWTEIKADLGEPLYAFCSSIVEGGVELAWPLFEGETAYPKYAWTRKARAFVEAQRTAREQRRSV